MDIDIYQQCPCHTGKKIKFCCGKDIVNELNQIVAKTNSNQSLSALDQIERAIAKQGDKDCLLTLKTHIYFTQGEIEKATEANNKFVERHPNHPIGKQNEAMSALGQGDVPLAIEKLQDAVDLVTGDSIPLPMANTFKMLGSILLSSGHLIAARTHLQFALMIRGEMDPEIQSLLQESFRMPNAPLSLKTDFRLDPAPEGAEWADKHAVVFKAHNRGQFSLALKMLNRRDEQWPDQKQIVRGIAIVNCMLANEAEMATSWKRVSELDDVATWQAVEAEALSQLFLEEDPSGTLDIVAKDFEIASFDEAINLAMGNKKLVVSDCPPEDPFQQGPPPRHSFYILDREQIEASDDLTAAQIPVVIGEFLAYGKQTDREARVVLIAAKNEHYDAAQNEIRTTFDGFAKDLDSETVISSTTKAVDILSWNWQVPKGLPVKQHKELLAERRREIVVEQWPELKFSCLNGKTATESKDDSNLSIPLQALILNLEQSPTLQLSGKEDIAALREKLGIPEQEELDATTLEDEQLTPLRLRYVAPGSFSDDQLIRVYADSVSVGNTVVLKRIVPEILSRDSLASQIPRDICYSMLAQLSEDNESVLENLQLARQAAKTAGRSMGLLLVQEFEIRLSRGITDKLPELLQTIQKQYMTEANVEYQLVRVLTKFGLISPDGRTVSLPSAPPAAELEKEKSAIWTPDNETDSSAAGGDESGSKIWIPGAD
ncbi:MAG: hypothetical protein AAGA30_14270 [Planctomycetota bacterium]